MESDLIYREDAKNFVRHAYHKGLNPVEYIDGVPAADVRPVLRGEWIDVSPAHIKVFRCDQCGEKTMDVCMEKPRANFCPNCGADMRKVAEGEQVKDGSGMTELKCKFEQDEVCVNADCPLCADFCPVIYVPGVCRFEERWRKQNESTD